MSAKTARMNVWEEIDPESLQPGSLALMGLVVRCVCGARVALDDRTEPGTISPASGVGMGECKECGDVLRVRVVVERRGH